MSEFASLKERLWHAITAEISEEKIKAIIDRIKEIEKEDKEELLDGWIIKGRVHSVIDVPGLYYFEGKTFSLPSSSQIKFQMLNNEFARKIFDMFGKNILIPIATKENANYGMAVYDVKKDIVRWISRIRKKSNAVLLFCEAKEAVLQ